MFCRLQKLLLSEVFLASLPRFLLYGSRNRKPSISPQANCYETSPHLSTQWLNHRWLFPKADPPLCAASLNWKTRSSGSRTAISTLLQTAFVWRSSGVSSISKDEASMPWSTSFPATGFGTSKVEFVGSILATDVSSLISTTKQIFSRS